MCYFHMTPRLTHLNFKNREKKNSLSRFNKTPKWRTKKKYYDFFFITRLFNHETVNCFGWIFRKHQVFIFHNFFLKYDPNESTSVDFIHGLFVQCRQNIVKLLSVVHILKKVFFLTKINYLSYYTLIFHLIG